MHDERPRYEDVIFVSIDGQILQSVLICINLHGSILLELNDLTSKRTNISGTPVSWQRLMKTQTWVAAMTRIVLVSGLVILLA